MAEIRAFRGIRFEPRVAGDAAGLVAPPYDVVSGQARLALYERSPYNIARVDYGEDRPDIDKSVDHYTLAARELREWLSAGVLVREREPRLYVYDQAFELEGETRRRRAVFGALRLEEWEKGIVLPHEVTGAGAKLDRQRLLEATATHLSPIMGLYEPDGMQGLLDDESGMEAPVLDAVLPDARHTLRPMRAEAARKFSESMASRRVYVADGHHRYETSLTYRDARRAAAGSWTGEEAYNFVLAGLVAADDPGFVVLPTHRLLKLPGRADDLSAGVESLFEVQPMGEATRENVERLELRLRELGKQGPAFGTIGLRPGELHLLLPRDVEAAIARSPADRTPAWRALDVTIAAYAVLPLLGYDGSAEHIDYSESAVEALEAVEHGGFDAAVLLNATTIEQVIAVSGSGDRMARKSTFFYPKLATGVVMMGVEGEL